MTTGVARVVSVVLMSLALAGCWESGEVTLHSPGEFKGTRDPLLGESASARARALERRFELIYGRGR